MPDTAGVSAPLPGEGATHRSCATAQCPCQVIPGCANSAATHRAGRIQPPLACQTAVSSAVNSAASRSAALAFTLQSPAAFSAGCAQRPDVPSVRCSSTPQSDQSTPSRSSACACCSVVRTPLRVRRDNTLSSGDTWGAKTPAGRPDAPAAGAAAWSSTCTRQPRAARLAAVAAPAIPPPTTMQSPGTAGAVRAMAPCGLARGSQRGL